MPRGWPLALDTKLPFSGKSSGAPCDAPPAPLGPRADQPDKSTALLLTALMRGACVALRRAGSVCRLVDRRDPL